MILSITGGVPWYIEQTDANYSAPENIRRLCFEEEGILVKEFNKIFHDLFGRRGEICRRITRALSNRTMSYDEIAYDLEYQAGGPLSEYLDDLETAKFISRDHTWSLLTGKSSKLSHYRLSDHYVRFYLKYIEPKKDKIKQGQLAALDIASLPDWESMLGLQFENLVLNNRNTIQQLLNIAPREIVSDNPFFQRPTQRQKGCQIDYLIHTQFNTLFVCEIKFSKNEIGASVIEAMKDKISRLKTPKRFTCVPVLIHVNGVSEAVEQAGYFYKSIDFSELLEAQ